MRKNRRRGLPAPRQRAEKARQNGAKNLTAMSDLVRREGKLVDRARRGARRRGNPPLGSSEFPARRSEATHIATRRSWPMMAMRRPRPPTARCRARCAGSLGELMKPGRRADRQSAAGTRDRRSGDAGRGHRPRRRRGRRGGGRHGGAILALQKGGQSMRSTGAPSIRRTQQQGRDSTDRATTRTPATARVRRSRSRGPTSSRRARTIGSGRRVRRRPGRDDRPGRARAATRSCRALGQAGVGAQYGEGSDTKVPGCRPGRDARGPFSRNSALLAATTDLSRPPEERDYIGRRRGSGSAGPHEPGSTRPV